MTKYNIQLPSGFFEFSPSEIDIYCVWAKKIRNIFSRYGYSEIKTPHVERSENLLIKSGNPKEMYCLERYLAEEGGKSKNIMLRFDHTVPLGLYVARHKNEITFPFRRMALGSVFRGERAQKGRYREFEQCDIDVIVRDEKLSLHYTAEVLNAGIEVLKSLNIGDFRIKVNHRKLVTDLWNHFGKKTVEEQKIVNDIIDSRDKVSEEKFTLSLQEVGIPKEVILFFLKRKENLSIVEGLENLLSEFPFLEDSVGRGELLELDRLCKHDVLTFDISAVRGLDYYTGIVFETELVKYPEFRTIAAGGVYGDLARNFTEEFMPGVGFSIGITRLLKQCFDSGIVKNDLSIHKALFTSYDVNSDFMNKAAQDFRKKGWQIECLYDTKKIGKKLEIANKKRIRFVGIFAPDEEKNKQFVLKDLETGKQHLFDFDFKEKDLLQLFL